MKYELLESKALAAGITDIELYSEKSHKLEFSLFDHEIDQREETTTEVYAVRGVYNNQIAIVHTEKGDDSEIDRIILNLKIAAENITKDDPFFIYEGDKEYSDLEEKTLFIKSLSTDEKINLFQKVVNLLEKDNSFYHAECSYSENETVVTIQNSKGLSLKRNTASIMYMCSVALKHDNDIKDAYDYDYIASIEDFDCEKISSKILSEANSKFGAESIASNSYKVVLQNNVVSNLISVYQSAFYATSVKQKTSFLENMLGKKVFGENVTLIDNPFLKFAPYQVNFDDEGVATRKTNIIQNGVLQTYLHNLSTAKYFNTNTTGNGYKASISSNVSVQSSYLCLEPGKKSFEELLKEVENGVLVTSITGLHAGVNVISGEFNLQASGYLIENGQKTKAISLIILSGKFQDLLNSIVSIGSDAKLRSNVYAPSLYIKQMNISGK